MTADRARFHDLIVTEIRRETDDAVSLAFDVPPSLRDTFAFIPGQYLTLRTTIAGAETRRSYSICSGPGEPLQVAVKRLHGGLFSSWAHGSLQAGHVLSVLPPQGRFVLPPGPPARTVLGVAAGSGITPVIAVAKALLATEPGSRFVLVYGSRSTGQILFREALEALKDRHMARLSVTHVLSRERQDIPVQNGRIDAAKLAVLLPGLAPTLPDAAMLCGPGAMIEAAAAALVAAGVAAGRVLSERFTTGAEPARTAPPPPVAPSFATASIRVDGVLAELGMAEGETVLEAGLRAGLDLPWSCRGGMCSTCRARVTAGAVAMDVQYGLEPWEAAAGFVLTCQSRPTTPHLAVDYDAV